MSTHSRGFLTATPDFSGSIFTSQDLAEARSIFHLIFERYLPNWGGASVGVLGKLWRQDARPAVERLIDIALLLSEFSRGITVESEPVFGHKVRQLINCQNEAQFEELLAELRVGAFLSVRAGPVACEPLARPYDHQNALQPCSPDFGIRLPEGDILIEVTTLRIGVLDHWERALTIVRERIGEELVKAGMAKEVEIHAPLRVRADALTRRVMIQLLAKMKQSSDGAAEIALGPNSARVTWREMTFIEIPSSAIGFQALPQDLFPSNAHFSVVVGSSSSVQSASASKIVLVLDSNVDELFLRSIRNTIDAKRRQFVIQAPALLILQLGSWRIPLDYVLSLINKRIWPNSQYAWLTGIGIFQPRQTFSATAPPPKLVVSWNPNPKEPRTSALNDLIEANAWYSKGQRVEPRQ